MDEIFEKLKEKGCDVEKTRERFMNDDEFYMECYRDVLFDKGFEELGENLKEHKISAAFDSAHMLKGIVANMGIVPLLNKIVVILEPLRGGDDSNLEIAYEELLKERDYYRSLIPKKD